MKKVTNPSIAQKIEFGSIKSKKVEANFNGGLITSDAGVLLLRQAEQKIGLLKKLSSCITDTRHKSYTKHTIENQIKQRVFAIACGYEDVNDHEVNCVKMPCSK